MCVLTPQYPNKNVALVASDILHLLISYVDHLQKFPPDTPKKIVEVRRTHATPFCKKLLRLRDKPGTRFQTLFKRNWVGFGPQVMETRSLPGL